MANASELLIAGIPRSGSTLLAALFDSLEDTLCLSEPSELFIPVQAEDRDAYVQRVRTVLAETRRKVLAGEPIVDRRNPDGTPTTNYVQRDTGSSPSFEPPKGEVDTSRYSPDMLVAIKHNIPFFAVMPELVATGIRLIGIVRHPLPTILSWQETRLPVASGFMPSAQAFWPELNQIMAAAGSPEEGRVRIYDAFCERLLACRIDVLKYEDVIADTGLLEKRVGRRLTRQIPIRPRAVSSYQGSADLEALERALREHARALRSFYPDLD